MFVKKPELDGLASDSQEPITEKAVLLSFSVVIEWENARLSDIGRSQAMLRELYGQIDALEPAPASPAQIVILYDSRELERTLIEGIDATAFSREDARIEFSLVPAGGMEYYEQKNFGAQVATSDLIIFLDSDVIPQPGWLAGLLEAFRNPEVEVVGGHAFISPQEGTYNKAFATFWFFPIEEKGTGLRRTEHFFANNVAFRRSVFEANPFPKLPIFRGQCTVLARNLKDQGIGMFIQPKSAVEHPPPQGPRHFVARALCHGYDHAYLFEKQRFRGNPVSFVAAFVRCTGAIGRSLYRVVRHHKKLSLGPTDAIVAIALATSYYSLKLLGEWLSLLNPKVIPRYFRI